MAKHGKTYLDAAKLIEEDHIYSLDEAIDILGQFPPRKFDETLEMHARLGIDPRQADQAVRTSVNLPHGTGQPVRVLVFAAGEAERVALDAGADYAGTDEYVQQINDGWLEFDATIAMADQMSKVGGLGRVLGRRGLMPNPRSGTVVRDVADLPDVIREVKGGRVEFRNDRTGNVHTVLGKRSFTPEQTKHNVLAFVDALNRAKPSGIKGIYCRKLVLTTTMGPGIVLDVNDTINQASAAS
jgi:large subunit ribosomal protein L1